MATRKTNGEKAPKPMSAEAKMNEIFSQLLTCDSDTVTHCLRVGKYAARLLAEVQTRYPRELDYGEKIICFAGTLHDLGKVKTPVAVLLKPSSLSREEYEIIMKHPEEGSHLFRKYFSEEDGALFRVVNESILYHHERYTGNGYPGRMSGDSIPFSAQIVGLADCFDALTSIRPYKPAFGSARSLQMIRSGECGSFAPELLECAACLIN